MGPLRIIILAVLIYIGYRLITKSFKKDGNQTKADDETHYFCSEECCKKFTSEKGDDI